MKTLTEARIYAASFNRKYAAGVFNDDAGFASHVTDDEKREIASKNIELAEKIERGEKDHNMTVAQRINYHMTGDCHPLMR